MSLVFRSLVCLAIVACNTPRSTKLPDETDEEDGDSDVGLCRSNEDCQPGQGCLVGEGCRDQICTPGQDVACLDESTALACHVSGVYFEEIDCLDGLTCDNAAPLSCTPDFACIPESTRCKDDDEVEVCDADGTTWLPGDTCAADDLGTQCYEGACRSACDVAELLGTNVGCVFAAADLSNFESAGSFGFIVINPSQTLTASVALKTDTQTVSTTSVAPGARAEIAVASRTRYNDGTGKRRLGYRLESDVPVVVYQANPLSGASATSADTSTLLPRGALDVNYVVLAWGQTGGGGVPPSYNGGSLLAFVALESVDITVRSTAETSSASGAPALVAGEDVVFHLDAYDVAQFETTLPGEDFSGTVVSASARVAVFAGNGCARVPAGTDGCDYLEEQLPGTSRLSATYIVARSPVRGDENDRVRITATVDDTLVQFYPADVADATSLSRGEMMMVTGGGDYLITADQPVLVSQYLAGSEEVGASKGDPAMLVVPPPSAFRDGYAFSVPVGYDERHLVLTFATPAPTFELDGEAVTSEATVIADSNYAVLRLAVAEGVHVIEASAPFGAVLFGYKSGVAFAMPAGL